METIKSFTSLEQAKILEKILQPKSADMCYIQDLLAGCKYGDYQPYIGNLFPAYGQGKIRCWSLVALLNVLPSATLDSSDNHYYRLHCEGKFTEWHDNPVDACYEMIVSRFKEENVI